MKNTFGRNLYVNVLANLIAAAIIYLIGAAVGWLPRNAAIISLAGVAIGAPIIVVVVVDLMSGERIDSLLGLLLMGIGGAFLGPSMIYFGAQIGHKWIAIPLIIYGVIFSISSIAALGPIIRAIHSMIVDPES